MKITEITEGWGEYSNKSNHRMNKFKRDETDESWASSAMDAGKAALGAVGRSGMRGLRRGAAKMGSGRAQGALQMDKAVMGVMKNYQRYLGQGSLPQNYASLQNYLKALGIENPQMRENFAPGADPVKGQKGVSTELSRNQVAEIIRKNLEAAMKAGTLPKEIKKFLGQ